MKLTQDEIISAVSQYALAKGFEGAPYVKLIVQDTGRADVTVTAEIERRDSPVSQR